MSAIDQLEVIGACNWSGATTVSVCIYYQRKSWAIRWWRTTTTSIPSLFPSFCTAIMVLISSAGRITKEKYGEMKTSVTPITSLDKLTLDEIEIDNCDTWRCPVR